MYGIKLHYPITVRLSNCWSPDLRITEVLGTKVMGLDCNDEEVELHVDWLDGPTEEDVDEYLKARTVAEERGECPKLSRHEEDGIYHLRAVNDYYRELENE